MRRLGLIFLLMFLAFPVMAQSDDMDTELIEIAASDDLTLVGDLYRPDEMDDNAPAILLMHMLNSQRSAYDPLIPYLLDAGYIVLNVDLRGHGDTGGFADWDLALEDVQAWFDWLREQDGVDASRVATIGASIGSNVALLACGNDADCVTAVALSPGENYRNVEPVSAISEGLNAFLIAAHNDSYSADSVRTFLNESTGFVNVRLYTGSAHGTRLFDNSLESVANAIVDWLDEQLADVEAM